MNEEFLNFQDLNCIGGEKLLVNLWKVWVTEDSGYQG